MRMRAVGAIGAGVALASVVSVGCAGHGAPGGGAPPAAAPPAAAPGPLRVQAGDRLAVLGVTDDGFALYWDAGTVYATELLPGAPRAKVVDAALPPLTLAVGRVALIWTAQDPGAAPGVGPLVVWTHALGARQASSASWSRALFGIKAASAVSPDGREILFVSNVSADGKTGDIVRATPDLASRTTLASGVLVSPAGACPPHVGFDVGRPDAGGAPEPRRDASAVVLACPAGAEPPVATLSRWRGDHHEELSTSVAAGSWWGTDARGDHLYARLRDLGSVVFDRRGAATVVEPLPSAGWINDDGTLILRVTTSDTTAELRRYALGPTPQATKLQDLAATERVHFPGALPGGFPYANVSTRPTSPDGRFFLGYTRRSPDGFGNIELVDLSTPTAKSVMLEEDTNDYVYEQLATPDSTHVLYYKLDQAKNATLFAATRDGSKRQISRGPTATETFGLHDAVVAFSDNLVGDGSSAFDTTDIRVADLSAEQLAPVTIAGGAYMKFALASGRRALVFSSRSGPLGPGLYLARL
jgi:hypothetical protein